MLTTSRAAGVAPEAILRNPLKSMADVTRNPKQGYKWPDKKGLMSSKNLKIVSVHWKMYSLKLPDDDLTKTV